MVSYAVPDFTLALEPSRWHCLRYYRCAIPASQAWEPRHTSGAIFLCQRAALLQ